MQSSRLNRQSLGIPDEKGRYVIQRDLVIEKVNTLLLPLMRKHDIDMWITLDRETTRIRLPPKSVVRAACATLTSSSTTGFDSKKSSSFRIRRARTSRRDSTMR